MGNFVSQPIAGNSGKQSALAAFAGLADMICKFPALARDAKFILIPGKLS